MKRTILILACALFFNVAHAQSQKYKSLFNGKNLKG